ncbi:MAG: penicillin-binding protein [Bacilli bacterium]
MKSRIKSRKVLYINLIILVVFFVLIYRLTTVSAFKKVDGYNLKDLESTIKQKKDIISSKRGSILDSNGNILAESVYTYRIVAYVDPKRSKSTSKQVHVSDIENTANIISTVVGEKKENIEKLLNDAILSGYTQTYLGSKSSNITVNQKSEIEEYDLPGITFEERESRSYPYGNFASYQIGYAKYYEETNEKDAELVGELGVESSYNDLLSGTDGMYEYIADANGTRIPNTAEKIVPSVDGNDVYLTLDKDIQLILENAIAKIDDDYNPNVALVIAASAKTGEILGVTSTPSFNPNERDINSYINPLHEMSIEPGSTMKTFTYASAIEDGVYDGNYKYRSGNYTVHDQTIYDWNMKGWGTINLDQGYLYSSNTGSAIIGYEKLGKNKLMEYHEKLGFGKKTDFDLPGEVKGDIEQTYDIDTVAASYGQGIAITPIQMIQALTVFGTNGSTMKPYIVDKVVDSKNNVIHETKPTVSEKNIYSQDTIYKMKEMMRDYVQSPNAMSQNYNFSEYGLFGKTGTAEISNSNGTYLTGANNYIFSFTGLMPFDDPEIIVYGLIKQPKHSESLSLIKLIQEVVPGIAEIKNISIKEQNNIDSKTFYMGEYEGLSVQKAKKQLSELSTNEVIILGDGENVLKQYPKAQYPLRSYSKVYLLTDGSDTMPNLIGMSYKDAAIVMSLYGIGFKKNGIGKVVSQSVKAGTKINPSVEVNIELK